MKINIDEQIDKHRCPAMYFCTITTTEYDQQTKEHLCYLCWRNYCKENNIEIIYEIP